MVEKITFKERVQSVRPSQVIWPIIFILVVLGIALGISNYQQSVVANKVPDVTINKLQNNTTVTDATITFSGTVDEGDKLTVNGKAVHVGDDGKFTTGVALVSGKNNITIVATGTNGKSNIVTRQITREIPIPVTTTSQVAGAQATPSTLTASGPETNYVLSAAIVAAALAGWFVTRKDLARAALKREI